VTRKPANASYTTRYGSRHYPDGTAANPVFRVFWIVFLRPGRDWTVVVSTATDSHVRRRVSPAFMVDTRDVNKANRRETKASTRLRTRM